MFTIGVFFGGGTSFLPISSYVDYLLIPFAHISIALPFFLSTYRRFAMIWILILVIYVAYFIPFSLL